MIVTEANAEASKVLRDAISEKEQLMADVRRVQALLRSALAVVEESPVMEAHGGDAPTWVAAAPAVPPAGDEPGGIQELAG